MKHTALGIDRLALMQTFVRIVDAGSLSTAAQQLGTSQPTVSRRLQQLEGLLGTYQQRPLSPENWDRLERLPQFRQ